ncbi:unnamed protein product [Phaedon cochleariae]|uniref:WD repeat-containing protein 74 n=1 Tax=Phaedon cochleariae TaxID=80249 RepID=A0A9N9SHS9_PHACE|nr:unnamed protein product [Phaedon cochleariae]
MDLNKFNIFVGSVRGFIISPSDKPDSLRSAKPDKAAEVSALSFGRDSDEIFVGFNNGLVSLFSSSNNKYINSIPDLEGEGSIIGLDCIDKSALIAKSDGMVSLWDGKKCSNFKISVDDRGKIDALTLNKSRENVLGAGGEFNDFKLWDIETQQCIFKAKSLGHDKLNLPIPTSIRGITFFPAEPTLSCSCTKEGHVLLYDDRAQRRPTIKYLETKASYTCIAHSYRDRQCLVGTTRGYMQLLDMRIGKCSKTFTTFTGSVSSIVCDPAEPYVATASLDRFLRIHNLDTKELLHKVYMKQSLTRLLMIPIVKEEPKEEEQDDEKVDEEYENIFENMEVVTDGERKKKKKKKVVEEFVTETKQGRKKKKDADTVVGDKIKKKRLVA